MTAEEREEYLRKLSVPREEERKRRAGQPIPLEWKLKQKASNKRIPCDDDIPLYVSLLRRKLVRGDIIVVRVQKPGHKVKTFGSSEFTLSERIKHATAYLETLS